MNITEAEYIKIDGHPFLRMIIDGKEALVGDFKWPILQLGFVPLHSRDPEVDWSKILPPIILPRPESEGEPLKLEGFTGDPIIISMAHDFWKAINHLDGKKFIEGPIQINKLPI
jgi:hypothetical protein